MRFILKFILISTAVFNLTAGQNTDDSSYTDSKKFKTIMLDEQNQFRNEHAAEPLVWNDTLAEYAEAHTKECVFKHSGGPYGENLAAGYANATAAVDGWGNERDNYNFRKGTFSEGTGHFTQMVWNTTTQLGCAAVDCNGLLQKGVSSWYLMCEYYPPGNVIGEFTAHVNAESGSGRILKAPGLLVLTLGMVAALGLQSSSVLF